MTQVHDEDGEIRYIEWVEIADLRVAAAKVVCPECDVLWLDSNFDTTDPLVFIATCPHGHSWEIHL